MRGLLAALCPLRCACGAMLCLAARSGTHRIRSQPNKLRLRHRLLTLRPKLRIQPSTKRTLSKGIKRHGTPWCCTASTPLWPSAWGLIEGDQVLVKLVDLCGPCDKVPFDTA